MLKEFPMGIESTKIIAWISNNLGQTFDYRQYNCNSIYEFINKFIMPTTEITIINNKPDSFLIRSKQIYSNTQSASGSYQKKSNTNLPEPQQRSESQSSAATDNSRQM